MTSKRGPQVKPKNLLVAESDRATKAKLRALGKSMERHDAAKPSRSADKSTEDLNDAPLVAGEVLRPGRLTLDGRRGTKIVWRTLLQLGRDRGRALRERAKQLDKSPSALVAQALAAYGIGGDYVDGEGV